MGKLRALKLGITKGIQHTLEYGNRQTLHRAVEYTISKLKCIDCNHASRAHTRVRPKYAGMEGEPLFKLLKETQDRQLGGMDECEFYYCDVCEALACNEHFDNDSCGGKHE